MGSLLCLISISAPLAAYADDPMANFGPGLWKGRYQAQGCSSKVTTGEADLNITTVLKVENQQSYNFTGTLQLKPDNYGDLPRQFADYANPVEINQSSDIDWDASGSGYQFYVTLNMVSASPTSWSAGTYGYYLPGPYFNKLTVSASSYKCSIWFSASPT